MPVYLVFGKMPVLLIYKYKELPNHLKDLECPPIDYSNHEVKKCMAGIRRIKGIHPAELIRIFGVMNPTLGHMEVRAAMLLSFRALLRKVHVTNSDSTLLCSDLEFHPWESYSHDSKSKTNQYRERIHKIPVAKLANHQLCAVHWMRKHLQQCPAPPDSQVFRIPRAGL